MLTSSFISLVEKKRHLTDELVLIDKKRTWKPRSLMGNTLPEKMSYPEKVAKQTGLSPFSGSKTAIYFIHIEMQNRDKFFVFTCRSCLVTITPSQSATLSFLILLMLDSSGFILWCGTRVSAFELRSMAVQLKVRQPTYNAVKGKLIMQTND